MAETNSSPTTHDSSRRRLYDIVANDAESLAAKRRAIADLGAEYLDVSVGYVSTIDTAAERFEVLVSTNEDLFEEGAVYDLSKTYCKRCVESESSVAVAEALEEGWGGDPGYEEQGFGCYLGTPIHVDGELAGTICFADEAPREESFTSIEQAFVELAARLLGREQEIARYDRELDERDRRLDERESELEDSEQKYESLVTTAPDPIFVADATTGDILEVNDAAVELTGVPAADLRKMSLKRFHGEDVPGCHWAEFQRFISRGEGSLSHYDDGTRLTIELTDGESVPVEVTASTVEIDGTEYAQGIVRDVSDRIERREKIERQRREREQTEKKYESLVQAAPDAIFLANLESQQFVELNDAATALTGYETEELLGETIDVIHPPGEVERYVDTLAGSLDDGGTSIEKLPDGDPILVERKNGEQVPVEISVAMVELDGVAHALAVFRDVTERRQRERELRIKNRAIDEASIGITIAEASEESNPIIYANEQFQQTTGYDWDEIEGRDCGFLQSRATTQDSEAELHAAIEAEEPIQTELLNYRKDGLPYWNELLVTPVEDGSGEVTHFVGFQQDVTDRKRKEKLITVLNRVLRHNLRNGMSVILNRAEQLKKTTEIDHQALDSITNRARELAAVGETAGDIGKAVAAEGSLQELDIGPMVTDIARRLDQRHESAKVSVTTPASQVVYATESLRAALVELGTNAIEHGGTDPDVHFQVEETDGGEIAISVSDDGDGLPPEEQTVLERGHETPLEHGSGLGLWFVTWVVTSFGGSIDVTVDDGTTVTLYLRTGADGSEPSRDHRSAIGS